MKRLIAMFFVALLAVTLMGCGGDECEECEVCEVCEVCEEQAFGYGTAYMVVHSHYVGVANVVVDENDEVVSVFFDEYYLPYSWAKVTPEDPENLPDTIVKFVSVTRGNLSTAYYAKYLSVDGVLYTATVTGEEPTTNEEPSQVIVYSATGVADFDVWVEDAANAEDYVMAIEAGNVFIADAAGEALDLVQADGSAMYGWSKTVTPYWSTDYGRGLGWSLNMKAIADALVGTSFEVSPDDIGFADGFFTIGDIVTGATLSDFVDYYTLAEAAYNAAVASKA